MRIVVNTRFWMSGQLEGYGYFTEQVFTRIARANPAHQFLFLFDRKPPSLGALPGNVEVKVVGPQARHPWLWKWWYDWRIPSVLSRFRADLFVSPDGIASLRTKVPQCLVVHDLAFLQDPEWFPRPIRTYYRKHTPRFLRQVNRIATVSELSKQEIMDRYAISADKIGVVYSAAKPDFHPLTDEECSSVKARFTEGKEFFLCTGAIHPRKNLIGLLKAFSLFKKRQQTGFKLVLAGRLAWRSGDFEKLLSAYKYRSDVVLTGYVDLNTLVELTAAAYAMVYPSFYEGFGVPVLEAMQSDVPVVTSAGTSMQEIAGPAALYADPKEPASIAEQMNRLYVDESLRRRLIEQGRDVARRFDWEETARRLWTDMQAAAQSD
ncbi:MAG: glycosyltransferase family 4 protein [Bacteroidota bacterium]